MGLDYLDMMIIHSPQPWVEVNQILLHISNTPLELVEYCLFSDLNQTQLYESFVETQLGALIHYDADNHTRLVETLSLYLQNNCNILHTADAAYTHRNTIKYRIHARHMYVLPHGCAHGENTLHYILIIPSPFSTAYF